MFGEEPSDTWERRPAPVASATSALDGSGGKSAPRTVTPNLLSVLMTLRHGG